MGDIFDELAAENHPSPPAAAASPPAPTASSPAPAGDVFDQLFDEDRRQRRAAAWQARAQDLRDNPPMGAEQRLYGAHPNIAGLMGALGLQPDQREALVEAFKDTGTRLKDPMGVLGGALEFAAAIPNFAVSLLGGLQGAERAMRGRPGFADIYAGIMEGMEQGHQWLPVYEAPEGARGPGRTLFGDVFMAPGLALAHPFYRTAESDLLKDYPNVAAALKASGDIAGFLALGAFHSRGRRLDTKGFADLSAEQGRRLATQIREAQDLAARYEQLGDAADPIHLHALRLRAAALESEIAGDPTWADHLRFIKASEEELGTRGMSGSTEELAAPEPRGRRPFEQQGLEAPGGLPDGPAAPAEPPGASRPFAPAGDFGADYLGAGTEDLSHPPRGPFEQPAASGPAEHVYFTLPPPGARAKVHAAGDAAIARARALEAAGEEVSPWEWDRIGEAITTKVDLERLEQTKAALDPQSLGPRRRVFERQAPHQATILNGFGAGAYAGLDYDEDGHPTFDPTRALLGMLAVGAGAWALRGLGSTIGIWRPVGAGGRYMRREAGTTPVQADPVKAFADALGEDAILPHVDGLRETVQSAYEHGMATTWLEPIVVPGKKGLRWGKNPGTGYAGNEKMAYPNPSFPMARNTWDLQGCGRGEWCRQNGIQEARACYAPDDPNARGDCYAEQFVYRNQGAASSLSDNTFVHPVTDAALRTEVEQYVQEHGIDAARGQYPDLQIKPIESGKRKGGLSVATVDTGGGAARVSTDLQNARGMDMRIGVDTDGAAWLSKKEVLDAMMAANPRSLTVFSAGYHTPPPPHPLAARTIINVTVSGWHPLAETMSRLRYATEARKNGWNVILREVTADPKAYDLDTVRRYNRVHDALMKTDFFMMEQPLHKDIAGRHIYGESAFGLPDCCKADKKAPRTCDNCEVAEGTGREFRDYWGILEEPDEVMFSHLSNRHYGIPAAAGEIPPGQAAVSRLRAHPDFAGAKAGGVDEAYRLVGDLVNPATVEHVISRLPAGKARIIVQPVISWEAGGKNKIPAAIARHYAKQIGDRARVGTDILQSRDPHHTDKGMMSRLLSRGQFAGQVEQGGLYLLVDDVTTSGGTLAGLADYIQKHGGRVVGTTSLANASRSRYIAQSLDTIGRLKEVMGDELYRKTGIQPEALTGPEAQYLARFTGVDSLGNRIAKDRNPPGPGEVGRTGPDGPAETRGPLEVIKDINAALGDRGSVGPTPLTPGQEAARLRLSGDLTRLVDEARTAGKSLYDYLVEQGTDPAVAAALSRPSADKYAGSTNLNRQDLTDQARQAEQDLLGERAHAPQSWQDTWDAGTDILAKHGEVAKGFAAVEQGLLPQRDMVNAMRRVHVTAVNDLVKSVKGADYDTGVRLLQQYQDTIGRAMNDVHHGAGALLNSLAQTVAPEDLGRALGNLEKLTPEKWKELRTLDLDDPVAVRRFAGTLKDPKLADYFLEYWYNSVLSGPATHMVNILGNTLWAAYQVPHHIGTSVVDRFYSTLTGKARQRFLGDVVPMLAGYRTGFKKGAVAAWEAARHGKVTSFEDKLYLELGEMTGAWERSPNPVLRKLAPYITVPSKALRAMDVWFSSMAYDAHARVLARRASTEKGLTGTARQDFERAYLEALPEADHARCLEAAKHATFTDDPDPFTAAVQQLRSTPVAGPALRLTVMPFVNTISNIVKRGIEMTPGAGIVKEAASRQMGRGRPTPEVIAKQVEGAVLSWVILQKAAKGDITGAAPTNAAERDRFYEQGKLPYAIRVGDTWVQYRRAEPFNTVINMAYSAWDALQKAGTDDDREKIFYNFANSVKWNVLDGSYFAGLSSLFDRHDTGKKAAPRWAASWMPYSSFWRQLGAGLEAAGKGYATVPDTTGREWLGAFSTVLPWLRDDLPPRLNVWGEESIQPGGIFRQWLPYKWRDATSDPVEIELERLARAADAEGRPALYPAPPGRELSSGSKADAGNRYELPDDVYRSMVIEFGAQAKQRIGQEIASAWYKAKPVAQQMRRLSEILESERDKAHKKARQYIRQNMLRSGGGR